MEKHWLQWSKSSLEEESVCPWILKGTGRKMIQYRSERGVEKASVKDRTQNV